MKSAPTPENELERLAALRRYSVLDTAPELDLDALTSFIASVCEVPMAAISLMDAGRQWFKSSVGLSMKETPREVAFCAHTIMVPDALFAVRDTRADRRFANNPLVTGDPGVRFYAGMPIVSHDGYALGTICVLDRKPRELTALQLDALTVAARLIMALIENNATALRLGMTEQAKHAVEQEHLALANYLTEVENERVRVANELHAEAARRARFQNELDYSKTHDSLTSLANRGEFMKLLAAAFAEVRPACDRPRYFTVYVVDIDHCKQINDTLGNKAGDDLLVQCAERLLDVAGPDDVVARLDSDTFAIMAFGAPTTEAANSIALSIRAAFEVPWHLAQIDCVVSASVGIVVVDGRHSDAEHVMREADIAMYHSKRQGRNRHSFFAESLGVVFESRVNLNRTLALALANNEFELAYQPIVGLTRGQPVLEGFEALLRWQRRDGVRISPAEFIPAAEESGLIVPLGTWVLKTACLALQAWRAQSPSGKRLQMSVNVSAIQLSAADFSSTVRAIVRESGIDPRELVIEVTESAVMHDPERSLRALRELRELGIGIHVDDFGTGYSSLSYLRRLPVTRVKIDRSFVSADGREGLVDPVIVAAIISLAHRLNLKVIAEGVETLAQWNALCDLGCDSVQGYFISRPCAPDDAARFVPGAIVK